jgi:hypothetical protein
MPRAEGGLHYRGREPGSAETKAFCQCFGTLHLFLTPIPTQSFREKPVNEARLPIKAET